MIPVIGLDHVVLRVADLDAMARFYTEVLGAVLERELPDRGLRQYRLGDCMIDFVSVDGPIGRAGGAAAGAEGRNMDHFCLRVRPWDEAAILAELAGHGLTAEVNSRYGAEGQGPSIYLTDPEGNGVELKASQR